MMTLGLEAKVFGDSDMTRIMDTYGFMPMISLASCRLLVRVIVVSKYWVKKLI